MDYYISLTLGTYFFILDDTRNKILSLTCYSSRLEEVLLALLKDQQILKDKFDSEVYNINSKIDNVIQDGQNDKQKINDDLAKLTGDIEQKIANFEDNVNDNLNNVAADLNDKFDLVTQDIRDQIQG